MKRLVSFFATLLTVLGMSAKIKSIDVHSHIVTDDYLKYLAVNDALMEDGYPLPTWDEESHIAFMDSTGIERSILTLSSPQAIKMLLTVTTPDHIMFGTDYPFVPTPILEKVAEKVKDEITQDMELSSFDEDILRVNAMKLFKIEE